MSYGKPKVVWCNYCGRDSAVEDVLVCQDKLCHARYCTPCGIVNLGAAEVHKLNAVIKGWQCFVCGTKSQGLQDKEAARVRERKAAIKAKRDRQADNAAKRRAASKAQLDANAPQGAAGLLRWMKAKERPDVASAEALSAQVEPGAEEPGLHVAPRVDGSSERLRGTARTASRSPGEAEADDSHAAQVSSATTEQTESMATAPAPRVQEVKVTPPTTPPTVSLLYVPLHFMRILLTI